MTMRGSQTRIVFFLAAAFQAAVSASELLCSDFLQPFTGL
jgi:hypothetical protein